MKRTIKKAAMAAALLCLLLCVGCNDDSDIATESSTGHETDAISQTQPEASVTDEPATEPATHPAIRPATEPASESVSEPETEPATEPATESMSESEPETEPTTEPATESASESMSESEPVTELVTEPMTEHYHGYTTIIVEPTCTEQGYTIYTCSCGYSYEEDYQPSKGHKYANDVCERCGQPKPTSQGLTFTLNDDGSSYSVTDIGTCTDKDIVIPSVYDGKPVTGIGEGAFNYCDDLTSIDIPDSVINIGAGAFSGCSRLKSITIGNGVTSIVDSLFSGLSGLTSITIGNSVTSIGDYAFGGCTRLTSVTIGNSVTSIGDGAFYECSGLTSITIPDSVTSIGCDAFSYCSSLTSVYITDIASWCNIAFKSLNANPLYYVHDLYLDDELMTSVTIPDSVTSIGGGAFYECYGLTSITIPDSVTSIGDYAFNGCSSLTSIVIPDSVTSIGNNAFYGTAYYENDSNWTRGVLYIGNALIDCKSDKAGAVTIKDGTVCIADSAFSRCSGLTSITIPDSVTSIGDSAFSGTPWYTAYSNDESNWTDGLLYISSVLMDCKVKTGAVTIKEGTTCIAGSAFYNCSGLTSITIPNSVTSIGDFAFRGCSGLTNINFEGTKEEWNAISKESFWNYNTGSYTIHCTDGDYSKYE